MAAKDLTPTERRHIRIIRDLLSQYELQTGAPNIVAALQREVDEFAGDTPWAENERREAQNASARAALAKFGEALSKTKATEGENQ